MIVFSSGFPHFEGTGDPVARFERELAGLAPERLDRFFGGSIADAYARTGDPLF